MIRNPPISWLRRDTRSSLKYKSHPYKSGSEFWLSKFLLKDALARSQDSDKLSVKRFGLFEVLEKIGHNTLRLQFQSNVKIHDVVNIIYTVPYSNSRLKLRFVFHIDQILWLPRTDLNMMEKEIETHEKRPEISLPNAD